MFLAAPCKGPLHVTLILTDTSLYCARQSLVPRMTVTDVWSGRVCAVGVCATIVQCIIAFIDIFVTVRSCPPRIKIATRRTSGNFVAYFTATVILAVLTPASGWTLWHTATTLYVRLYYALKSFLISTVLNQFVSELVLVVLIIVKI